MRTKSLLGIATLFVVALPMLIPSGASGTVTRTTLIEEFGYFT